MKTKNKQSAAIIDLFCGAGGLTNGFFNEGFSIKAGVDVDEDCRFAYQHNNKAPFLRRDINDLDDVEINDLYDGSKTRVLVGCAPCQPFSTYNQKNADPKWQLLHSFAKLIRSVKPEIVSMENVPSLVRFKRGEVFETFLKILRDAGYNISWNILYGPDYGLPQTRSRLVLLASLLGPIEMPKPTHSKSKYRTVEQTIGNLPRLNAGDIDTTDQLHRASNMSEINFARIKSAIPGGTWRDWDQSLVTSCHRQETGRGYVSVYGRMEWHKPAPTITTQFYGFGNGRFGHPEQDRALSLREGAMLQTFPRRYEFAEPGEPIYFKKIGRMIGNAVPVRLATVIARQVQRHLEERIK